MISWGVRIMPSVPGVKEPHGSAAQNGRGASRCTPARVPIQARRPRESHKKKLRCSSVFEDALSLSPARCLSLLPIRSGPNVAGPAQRSQSRQSQPYLKCLQVLKRRRGRSEHLRIEPHIRNFRKEHHRTQQRGQNVPAVLTGQTSRLNR